MFTEQQLIEFGNYLFRRYDVQEYSTDGKNVPLFQRQVSDADFCNWKNEANPDLCTLPSQFQHGDKAIFESRTDVETAPYIGIPCEVIGIHFYPGKVKYDLDLLFNENKRSRIYNVDSVLVNPI